MKENILVTGAAGFIGHHVVMSLLKTNLYNVYGIDSLNDYYSTELKTDRLKLQGIESTLLDQFVTSSKYPAYQFIKLDLFEHAKLKEKLEKIKFTKVIHLAAQAGVRYSIDNPRVYIERNIDSFFNIIDFIRINNSSAHFIYASSSSVYGDDVQNACLEELSETSKPVSLYAATKKSNELMAYTYSKLFKIKTTGLRFFTVYGPWGRPDMAPYIFTKSILEGKSIRLFNYGKNERDFTYIADIVDGIIFVVQNGENQIEQYKIYNIGNGSPIDTISFVTAIETALNKKAVLELVPAQKGDVLKTFANIESLAINFGYAPKTDYREGVALFVEWFKSYQNSKN